VLVETKTDVDGRGVLAGMVGKIIRVSNTTTVTNISVEALPDATFAVPEGWKREKK
jgi:hypothetical protein